MNWYDNGQGMMNGSAYGIIGMFIMVLFFIGLVWIIVSFTQHGSKSGHHHQGPMGGTNSSAALDHLNMRLAKGDISSEDYLNLKEHLAK